MRRRNLDYIIIAIMFLSGLYTTLTGLAMHVLDLHVLAFHHYAGYACAILAGIHLLLNWKKVKAFFRRQV
jgi:hypothetical protein